jgi:hypothetical protein
MLFHAGYRLLPSHLGRCRVVVAACTLLLHAAASGVAAQAGTVHGEVRDAGTRQPVVEAEVRIAGVAGVAVTGDDGRFYFPDVPAGPATLLVRHLAYGELSVAAVINAGGVTTVLLLLSDTAIALQPLEVEGISAQTREVRSAGFRRNVVTREQLAGYRGSGFSFSDVLRQVVPGIRVRTMEGIVGAAECIELRAAAISRNRCLAPAVFVDGVPITNLSMLYATFPLEMIESIEVVPASEAGARYGSGALYGAVLIVSRRPGTAAAARLPQLSSPFHDWSVESGRHATLRSFGAAAAGSGLGLVGGLAIAEACITTRAPSHDRIISSCPAVETMGAIAAAVMLPSLGSALGARLGGVTAESRGRLGPAAAAGAMAVVPGYAMILTGKRLDSDALGAIGKATLVLLTPFMSAIADHQFRRLRAAPPPE